MGDLTVTLVGKFDRFSNTRGHRLGRALSLHPICRIN